MSRIALQALDTRLGHHRSVVGVTLLGCILGLSAMARTWLIEVDAGWPRLLGMPSIWMDWRECGAVRFEWIMAILFTPVGLSLACKGVRIDRWRSHKGTRWLGGMNLGCGPDLPRRATLSSWVLA